VEAECQRDAYFVGVAAAVRGASASNARETARAVAAGAKAIRSVLRSSSDGEMSMARDLKVRRDRKRCAEAWEVVVNMGCTVAGNMGMGRGKEDWGRDQEKSRDTHTDLHNILDWHRAAEKDHKFDP
jgi:hypothetical protein